MKTVIKEEPVRKNVQIVITFRVFQAISFGILALGISLIFGDLMGYIKSPISTFATTTTIFGAIGSIVTGQLAKQAEKW
jgi:energy-converting hydrogenase Eha subunit A